MGQLMNLNQNGTRNWEISQISDKQSPRNTVGLGKNFKNLAAREGAYCTVSLSSSVSVQILA